MATGTGPLPTLQRPPARHGTLAFVLAFAAVVVNLLDVWVYPTATSDAVGIKAAGIRVTDLLAVAALAIGAVNVLAGRVALPRPVVLPLVLVTAAWTAGTVVGLANGHDGRLIFGQWHLVLYVWALLVAWAGAPDALLRRGEVLLPWLTLVVAVGLVLTGGGGDPYTVVAAVAAVALVRSRLLVALPLLVLAVVLVGLGGQRAALLFSLPPLVLAVLLRVRSRHPSRRALGVSAAVTAVLALVGLATAGTVATFVSKVVDATFRRTGKVESSHSRLDQATIALREIRDSPWLGRGLGFEYKLYDRPTNRSAMTALTHDVYLDLPLRLGLVATGVLVVVLAVCALQVLLRLPRLLPLQVAALGVLLGLLGKGAVESILDKPRLMLLVAWLVVTVLTARRTLPHATSPETVATR
ncbi:O-antigen ligase family protein [Kineococcus rhizosphaerae]|uniref:O-antigen ligase family protein n=1 Tax=Kineococcus rhizosphaerae TaxID=559628 RepID=UPI001476718E|nr:O-antigen ligase family protein [Kineococcus rhizosphaerae]